MNIGVIGLGFVGKTVSSCLAEHGHNIIAVDKKKLKNIETVYEDKLRNLFDKHIGNSIEFTRDYSNLERAEIIFITLPTPSRNDGSIDDSIVLEGLNRLSEYVDDTTTVVIKSTVTPDIDFEDTLTDSNVLINPEFLREGNAVNDFMNPDKIVIGGENTDILEKIYKPIKYDNMFITGKKEASMIKYANNTFLASKISVMNEIGNICKELDIDSYEVAEAIGMDSRINENYLESGLGFGGSCLPKDVRAIREITNYNAELIDAVLETNSNQPVRAVDLLSEHIDLNNSTVAVLGITFKKSTSDTRNSQSYRVIDELESRGSNVIKYDPVVNDKDLDIVVEESDGFILATGWDVFRNIDYGNKPIVDCRRVVDDSIGLTW